MRRPLCATGETAHLSLPETRLTRYRCNDARHLLPLIQPRTQCAESRGAGANERVHATRHANPEASRFGAARANRAPGRTTARMRTNTRAIPHRLLSRVRSRRAAACRNAPHAQPPPSSRRAPHARRTRAFLAARSPRRGNLAHAGPDEWGLAAWAGRDLQTSPRCSRRDRGAGRNVGRNPHGFLTSELAPRVTDEGISTGRPETVVSPTDL